MEHVYPENHLITWVISCGGSFFSEMMNLDGSAWNIQEKEDHEYYNEIPGKEPPTGGLLDTRIKVQTDQRANCPIQCEKQYCLVSMSISGITIHYRSGEEKTTYCGGEHMNTTTTKSFLVWEGVFRPVLKHLAHI